MAKVIPVRRSDEPQANTLFVLEYLAEHDFRHAPALLRTSGGDRFAVFGEACVSIVEYLPRTVDDGTSSPETWRSLGEVAARLNANSNYPSPFAVQLGGVMEDLARRVAGRPYESRFLELLARVDRLRHLPSKALVHGEINDANARKRADGTIVLVDWDQAGRAAPGIEYGYPLINVFLSEDDLTFDDRSASAFYEGYQCAGGVVEAQVLFDAALFHSLRYMWWGDTEQRWQRILHAVSAEAELCSVVP